ncbi:hypothetical protein TREMEDRAFT_63800 [Tremella mesenterica DSM 1558]|uniref:uncharacterized protein n=1 Tax=Tremella mesenterica (strain ATCC 24925 / CBS 8224 / DSM 1558 / NBRC 9311 / NRRL Y-6157 / RJB 2259-6 / UBC 559-6) TaxID=578456 RepID=UPI0003F48F52|nr:uncharacterized protein TREMEDRAFT_63800 [Tremella mesenterica DSM 1558]EIW67912.1 hypothetical protein TREMEDRAFT_63800 [Tremella mesenterica DSM 1558]
MAMSSQHREKEHRSEKNKEKKRSKNLSPPPALSKAIIETSDEDVDDDVDGKDGRSEEDSDVESDDLEGIQPRRKANTNGLEAPSRPTAPSGKRSQPYSPPSGMIPLNKTTEVSSSIFEWDRLSKMPGVELWAIRVPLDFKTSRLSSLSLSSPTSTRPPSGTLKTKHTTYSLVTAGDIRPSSTAVNAQGRNPTAGPGLAEAMSMDVDGDLEKDMRGEGGEEMSGGMRLLVPRASDGKLFISPIPITRHLLLTPDPLPPPTTDPAVPLPSYLSTPNPSQPLQPSSISSTPLNAINGDKEIKRVQPLHLLKFRNQAYGFDTPGPISFTPPEPSLDPEETKSTPKKEKVKKRKSEMTDLTTKKKIKV